MPDKKTQEAFRVRREMLSVHQAADEAGVSDQAIRDFIKRGELPAVMFGGSVGYRIERVDWERFLKARKVMATVMLATTE